MCEKRIGKLSNKEMWIIEMRLVSNKYIIDDSLLDKVSQELNLSRNRVRLYCCDLKKQKNNINYQIKIAVEDAIKQKEKEFQKKLEQKEKEFQEKLEQKEKELEKKFQEKELEIMFQTKLKIREDTDLGLSSLNKKRKIDINYYTL